MRRSGRQALRDEMVEAERPPGGRVTQVFDAGGVDDSNENGTEVAAAWSPCAVGRATHSRMRSAVEGGQPWRTRSVARCKSTSRWLVKTIASSQA